MSKIIDLNDIDDDEFNNEILEYLEELEGKYIIVDKFTRVSSKIVPSSVDNEEVIEEEYILQDEFTPKKLYFNTEFDSNQSKFESLSNQLKICTSSRNDIVGTLMLIFLDQIIDRVRYSSFLQVVIDSCEDEYPDGIEYNGKKLDPLILPIEVIIDLLYNYKKDTTDIQVPIDMTVKAELIHLKYNSDDIRIKSTKIIKRNILDIDIWNLHRIKCDLGLASPDEKYK